MAPTTAEQYVEANLRRLRARLGQRMISTSAGQAWIDTPGERRIFGPDGRPIKIVTDEHGGTVVSTDTIQAVHINANPITPNNNDARSRGRGRRR